jgi:dipeptidase
MTVGIDAGPYGCPQRWRPLYWEIDSVEYSWERPISTQQTGFSFVSQSRSWLPDKIGGVFWYGVDDTYTTCYTPLYCGIDTVPRSFAVGEHDEFSWESAWWVFNLVANYAALKYSYMAPEIVAVQEEIEADYFRLQPIVEKTALGLAETDPQLMVRYLTDYSVSRAEAMAQRWRELAGHLIVKYNDGYVREEGSSRQKGYPESWLRRVVESRGEDFLLPVKDTATPEHKLVD